MANWSENDPIRSEIAKDSPLDSPTKILDGGIGYEKAVENETVNNKVRNMENIEVLAKEMAASDIADIKTKREEYLTEFIEANKGHGSICGLNMSRNYRCRNCEAEFSTLPDDAKYCPACRRTDLRIIPRDEVTIGWRIFQKIQDENEAQIKELWSQKLSKKAIAEKLRISTDDVSSVVGIKKRPLPREKIDFIKKAYLLGHPEWEIKQCLDHVSEERIGDVVGDLCQEIKKAHDQGTRLEDIGKAIGIHGHDQAIIEIANRFIKLDAYLRDIGSKCTEPIGEL